MSKHTEQNETNIRYAHPQKICQKLEKERKYETTGMREVHPEMIGKEGEVIQKRE